MSSMALPTRYIRELTELDTPDESSGNDLPPIKEFARILSGANADQLPAEHYSCRLCSVIGRLDTDGRCIICQLEKAGLLMPFINIFRYGGSTWIQRLLSS
jgi:hypothetical protein